MENDIKSKSPETAPEPGLCLIVAMGRDRSIGADGDMPWHIREDLRHFKAVTMGHPVIMGRATWESLPKKPLPGRLNIVVTRNQEYNAAGAETASSIEEAVAMCHGHATPFVIGGGSVYRQALHLASRLFLTLVDEVYPMADTFFPELNPEEWESVSEEGPYVAESGPIYRFVELVRRKQSEQF